MSKEHTRFFDYNEIDRETVQVIFSNHFTNSIVDEISLIPEGQSTTNYIVYTNNKIQNYLLKIYPENDDKCAREYASYKYAKTKMNVPEIYIKDETYQLFHKPYMIIEYIESISLREFIMKNQLFPESIAYDLGMSLSKLHQKEYDFKALFNKNLSLDFKLPSINTRYDELLNGFAGSHINADLKEQLVKFLNDHRDLLMDLERDIVFAHGDFISSNILIDKNHKLWFIDFEYTLASSKYLDIGKFFRYHENRIMYQTQNVYDHFYEGYNKYAKNKLPKDWLEQAMLYDMAGMLSLINKEKPNKNWVLSIEKALKYNLLFLERV